MKFYFNERSLQEEYLLVMANGYRSIDKEDYR